MTLQCTLIDDERHALDVLRSFVQRTPGLQLAGSYTDPLKALSEINNGNVPDIAFIDVDMPQINGLDLAARLPKRTKIVFTTSFREYAADAYEQEAADYLMKPIAYERFLRCITRLSATLAANHPGMLFIKDVLKGTMAGVPASEVIFISAALNYLELHLAEKKMMVYGGLSDFADKLPPSFYRVHRSYIVNLRHVQSAGPTSLVMNNGAIIPVGGKYRPELRKAIRNKNE
jgi:DNA-binding LytR/AlgR family response regulator